MPIPSNNYHHSLQPNLMFFVHLTFQSPKNLFSRKFLCCQLELLLIVIPDVDNQELITDSSSENSTNIDSDQVLFDLDCTDAIIDESIMMLEKTQHELDAMLDNLNLMFPLIEDHPNSMMSMYKFLTQMEFNLMISKSRMMKMIFKYKTRMILI